MWDDRKYLFFQLCMCLIKRMEKWKDGELITIMHSLKEVQGWKSGYNLSILEREKSCGPKRKTPTTPFYFHPLSPTKQRKMTCSPLSLPP